MQADELKEVLHGPIAFIPTYFSRSGRRTWTVRREPWIEPSTTG